MRNKAIIDDGCNPELVWGASFDGGLELPAINPPKDLSIPSNLTPKVILVYGSMPRSVFTPYLQQAKFVHYMDWITRKHKESC